MYGKCNEYIYNLKNYLLHNNENIITDDAYLEGKIVIDLNIIPPINVTNNLEIDSIIKETIILCVLLELDINDITYELQEAFNLNINSRVVYIEILNIINALGNLLMLHNIKSVLTVTKFKCNNICLNGAANVIDGISIIDNVNDVNSNILIVDRYIIGG